MKAVIKKSATSLTLAAAMVGSFAVAHADRIDQLEVDPLERVPEIVVSYDDLDISNPRGLDELYSRIEEGAMSVCGYDRNRKELARQRRLSACYHAAVNDAIRQVNLPQLTALHHSKTKTAAG